MLGSIMTCKWDFFICYLALGLIFAMDVGSLPAGDIKGKVIIKPIPPSKSKIVSRSIIQKYASKSANNKEGAAHKPSVIVYIDGYRGGKPGTEKPVVVMDQNNEKFVPHVLPILVGTTVRFSNSDDVYHNVFSYSSTKSFNLGRYAKGKYRSIKFLKPGVVKVYCDIHTQMNAFILVLENPYFATVDEDGNFLIKDIPPGTYTLKAWYGRWPEIEMQVEVKGSGATEVNFVFP